MIAAFFLLALTVGGVSTGAPPVTGDAELSAYHQQARRAVDEVLSRREFRDLRDKPGIFERITAWFRWLFNRVGDVIGALSAPVLWLLVIFMVLVLLAILGHAGYVLYSMFGAGRALRSKSESSGRSGGLLGIADLDLRAVHDRAQALLAAGEWVEATKYLYVAAILLLDHQGLIAFRGWKTNSEYLRELGDRTDTQTRFRRLTTGFEQVAYGGAMPTPACCHEMAAAVDAIRAEGPSDGPR